jgi:hypothetical protein
MDSCTIRDNANKFLNSIKRKFNEVEEVKNDNNVDNKSSVETQPRKKILIRKLCIGEGCTKFAGFGHPGKKKIYCKKHRDEFLLSCKSNNSKDPLPNLKRSGTVCKGGCGKYPTYGPKESDLMIFCKDCKPVDYVSNKYKLYPECKILGCKKSTTREKVYCKDHIHNHNH